MTAYAVYGGSFDPIHRGHTSMIASAIEQGYEVIVVPAYRHAFGKRSAPFEHRVRMCELALQAYGLEVHARVCRLEGQLARGSQAPVYTYDLLCALREALQTAPRLLVGPDIEAEWTRWYQHEAIDEEFGRLSLPMLYPIRSTLIRQRLAVGDAPMSLTDCVPEPVLAYIVAHGLYGVATS